MQGNWLSKRLLGRVIVSGRILFLSVLVMMLAVLGFAKMYEEPRSFSLKDKSQEQVERKVLAKINIEALLAEDRARGKNPQRPGPQRFAVAALVTYALDNSGTWQNLPDGRLWRLLIQSPGAKNMNLGITRFEMPQGAKLWIYDPAHTHVEGPYTSRNRSRAGSLWTPMIEGDQIIVEVFVPTGVPKPTIEITKVNQGYRGLGTGDKVGLFGSSEGTCNNDIVCAVGDPWRDQIRAVGVYTISGTSGCTGTLMNNTAFDFTHPYVLSANHCGVSTANDNTIVMYWNFESATCGTHGPGSTADNQSGATYRASWATSDFVLFELDAAPDPSFNVFHAGWDATVNIPTSTVSIHHPRLDVKAISFSNSAPDTTAYNSSTHVAAGNHWYVAWDSGVTEGGSSGSCLFDTAGRCIGQLHGGPSVCGGTDLHDYYGRFSVSWTGGGTAATRLQDWLDPLNSGTLAIDGDPHITTTNGVRYDLQGAGEFVSLRDPNGLEVQVRQEPIATTSTPTDPHDGLATCVSLNTAVAARVGEHRVTYQPTLGGPPDPSGLQLRVDGTLATLGASGIDLGGDGHIAKTAAAGGLQIDFPDDSTLLVSAGWWASQSKWYLNVSLVRPPAVTGGGPGTFPTGGIAGAIAAGGWLPALPDGTSMGSMPAAMHDRYVALYQKFANAWRVTGKTSLFDYAPGSSTDTFTNRNWPPENPPCDLPQTQPLRPASQAVARQACRTVTDENMHRNCMFDVVAAGNTGFARTYVQTHGIRVNSTSTKVRITPGRLEGPLTITATVRRIALPRQAVPSGNVQFMLDGQRVGSPLRLDTKGEATLRISRQNLGKHRVSASYIPEAGKAFLPSISPAREHLITGGNK
jgi:lysyl endopeptidase